MSFLSDLFGGSEQTQTSSPTETTPEAFKALQGPIADVLKLLFGGMGGAQAGAAGGGAFTGVGDTSQFVSPITGNEQMLVDRISSLLGGGGINEEAKGLLSQTLSGKFLDPASNPFLQATIEAAQRPLLEQFRDVTDPGLRGAFTAADQRVQGEGSSAFARARAIESRGLFSALGDISTNIAGQNFQQERARQVQAITQSGPLSAQEINSTIQGLQAVALPRLIEQFGIDRGLEEFNRRIDTVLKAISLAQGLPLFAQGQVSTGTSSTSPNIFGTLISGLGVAFPKGF